MDYNKIGSFILNERKNKNLTQAKLAEKLFVSEKTISKWENGNGLPDTSILPKLCEILDVTLNELLNGERFNKDEYSAKAEKKLFELQKEKEESDKRLLNAEILVGIVASTLITSLVFIASFIKMPVWTRILLIAIGFLGFTISMVFALRIEQKAGLYQCSKCEQKYVPTYNQILWSMHFGRTRFMKCPHCNKRSWNKKVIK